MYARRYLTGVLAAVCAVALLGCMTMGRAIDPVKVAQVKEGVTTKAEVLSLLGEPTYTMMNPDGNEILMYTRTEMRESPKNFIPVYGIFHSEMDMKTQSATIMIDSTGVVKKCNWTGEPTPAK